MAAFETINIQQFADKFTTGLEEHTTAYLEMRANARKIELDTVRRSQNILVNQIMPALIDERFMAFDEVGKTRLHSLFALKQPNTFMLFSAKIPSDPEKSREKISGWWFDWELRSALKVEPNFALGKVPNLNMHTQFFKLDFFHGNLHYWWNSNFAHVPPFIQLKETELSGQRRGEQFFSSGRSTNEELSEVANYEIEDLNTGFLDVIDGNLLRY
jgi:hypothetical protein